MLIPNIFESYPAYRPTRGILHVGAHTFEEAPLYQSLGVPNDRILWVEANPDLVPRKASNVVCAAISNQDDAEANFYLTNHLQSSSLLKLKTHRDAHPWVHETSQRRVQTVTLNTLLRRRPLPPDAFDFLNLDIQGAEKMALEGATELLPHLRSIYTEVNVAELYEHCAQMDDLDAFLVPYGFQRVETVITEHGWGDAFYIKPV